MSASPQWISRLLPLLLVSNVYVGSASLPHRPMRQAEHPVDAYRVRPPSVPIITIGEYNGSGNSSLADALLTAPEVGRIGKPDEGEPHELFGAIEAVELDNAQRVYVLDSSFEHIRVYAVDGRYIQTVGRPGAGPGEFARISAMAVDPVTGTLYVADGARRVQRFAWQEVGGTPLLRYQSVIDVAVHARDLCLIGDKFLAHALTFAEVRNARATSQVPNLLHILETTGQTEASFGSTYQSPTVGVNLLIGWSIAACDLRQQRVYVTPESTIAETHAFDLLGRPRWIVAYASARPKKIQEWPDRSVQQTITPGGYHRTEATTVIDGGLLVQMALRVAAPDRGSVREGEIVSYFLAANDGTATALPGGLPLVVAANDSYFVERIDEPNPRLVVRTLKPRAFQP